MVYRVSPSPSSVSAARPQKGVHFLENAVRAKFAELHLAELRFDGVPQEVQYAERLGHRLANTAQAPFSGVTLIRGGGR